MLSGLAHFLALYFEFVVYGCYVLVLRDERGFAGFQHKRKLPNILACACAALCFMFFHHFADGISSILEDDPIRAPIFNGTLNPQNAASYSRNTDNCLKLHFLKQLE